MRSSLIHNKSARYEQHECDTSETRTTRVQHECDASVSRTTQEQHECHTNDTGVTRAKSFDFNNDTSENLFSHRCNCYMASERLQGEEQFHSKNYLLEMLRSYRKMRLKYAPQKPNFVMAKAISRKSCIPFYVST